MSTIGTRATSTSEPTRVLPYALNADGIDKHGSNGHDTSSNPLYWSDLVLGRQTFPHEVTRTKDGICLLDYETISSMEPYRNSSLEELRLAYYFYDLSPNGSRIPGGYQPERMVFRRSWEKPEKLVVPHPTCSFSRSAFTALFPATPIPTPAIAPQAPVAHVAAQAPLSTSQSNKTSEAPPVQAFAALGLGSHPTTPAKSDAVGIFEITFPRSPAAEQIPAVSNAETEWEASLRAVAWRKTLLHQAQNEYDKAVRAEKEKFKAYSETRMNLDQ